MVVLFEEVFLDGRVKQLAVLFFVAVCFSCSASVANTSAVEEFAETIRADVPEGWSVEVKQNGATSIIILKRTRELIESEYRLLPLPSSFGVNGPDPITLTIRISEMPFVSPEEWDRIRSEGNKAEAKIPAMLEKMATIPFVRTGKPVEKAYRKYQPRTPSEEELVTELRKLVQQRSLSRGLPEFWYKKTGFSLWVVATSPHGRYLPIGRCLGEGTYVPVNTGIILTSESLQSELVGVLSAITARMGKYTSKR